MIPVINGALVPWSSTGPHHLSARGSKTIFLTATITSAVVNLLPVALFI